MRWNKYRQIKPTCALAIVLTLNFLQTEAAAQMTEVSMEVGFVNARVASLWVAEKEGFFKRTEYIKVLKLAGGDSRDSGDAQRRVDTGYTDPT